MEVIAQQGALDATSKNFTNHGIRKTTVSKLQKAGVSNDSHNWAQTRRKHQILY